MKLTHVVTACNNNPKYTKFIPLFIERWNKLYPKVSVVIIFIATKLPAEFEKYSASIRLFSPINHINTAFCAQVIRLLVPCLLNTDDGILLTDIDMLPGNSTYFQKAIESYSDTFISLRPYKAAGNDQIAMCYVVAPRNIWTDIFNIRNEDDIRSFLTTHYRTDYDAVHGGNAWYSDQQILYNYVTAWEKRTCSKAIFLDDRANGFNRLDCHHHNYNKSSFLNLLNTDKFSDAHLYAHECTWSSDDIKQLVSENVPLCTTRPYYNLIFLIIDSDDHPVYKESRDIMRQYIHKFDNVLAYFIRLNEEITTEYAVDGDTLLMKGKETFIPGILEKTIKAVEYCHANYSFDYIVRTNLSSFWNIPKLQEKIRNTQIDNIMAYTGVHNRIKFPTGAGFIMSQNMCQILIQYKNVLLKLPYIDDVAIGVLLQSINIPITPGIRYNIINDNDHKTLTMEQVRTLVGSDNYHYRLRGQARNFESRLHQMFCEAVYATLL